MTESPETDKAARREATAEAKAAKARALALRPWYRKKRYWLLGVVAALVVAGVAGAGGDNDDTSASSSGDDGVGSLSANKENPPEDDVTVTKCEAGQFGPEVEVRIVNHSSKRSNYLVSLNLEDGSGAKVGEGTAASNNVEPSQTATEQILATASGPFERCVVKQVERYASAD